MRNNETEEEKRQRQADTRKSQFASSVLDADKKKLVREHARVEAEVRQKKMEASHLKADLEKLEIELRSSERKIEMVDEEISREKKHMNSI